MHGAEAPSEWVVRWAQLVTRGPVLDVASGSGRHARFFAGRGLAVVAVDNAPQLIPGVTFVQADLESGERWPFAGQRFAAVVVTNYLHRPLFAQLEQALDEGGVLIYETFMAGNERYGRPSDPAYLLQPGELLRAFKALTVVAFEQGTVERPKQAAMQRVCAVRGPAESARIAP
ncbi:MAG TPA: class I SAM-dependent methyltransferase [Burkholderiales bacterium]|nr:class I SAM-dependent methyltransferase [Burkholderiales bacterium]